MSNKLKTIVSKFIIASMAMSTCFISSSPAINVSAATTAKSVTNFSDLKNAVDNAHSGDVIEIASNSLNCTSQLLINKSGITIKAASGYSPVLDFTSFRTASKKASPKSTNDSHVGVRVSGSNNTIEGLTIEKAYDNGMLIKPSSSSNPNSNNIVNCVFSYNGDAGLQISGDNSIKMYPSNNHITGCVSYRNFDPLTSGGNADGFAAKLYLGTGTVFSYCVSAENSDDAWDSFGSRNSDITYNHCVAYHNGDPAIFTGAYDKRNGLPTDRDLTIGVSTGNGNGFKLGSGASKYGFKTNGVRNMVDCLAVDNTSKGFDQNNGAGTINLTNGMSFGNDYADYQLNLMKAGTFKNAQAFSSSHLKAPIGGTVKIITDSQKKASINSEVNNAIKNMRNQLYNKKIPSYMNFSFWN